MASGGDTWWLWLASSVENCLSSACLLVGVTLQMKMLRGAQQRKKKKRKTKNWNQIPLSTQLLRRGVSLSYITEPLELGSARGGGTVTPPPRLWAEKNEAKPFLFQKTISNTWCTPPDFLNFRWYCTEHYSKCEQGIKVAFFPISRRKSYPPDVMTQVLTT